MAMLVASFASSELFADFVLPSGLNPGDHYRIAFVTSGGRNATSSDIVDYNAFVTAQATMSPELALLSTKWYAIASTSSVNAQTNTFTGLSDASAPIYNTAGQLVVSSNADLWGGTLLAPMQYDQYGVLAQSIVWTGTDTTGAGYPNRTLGNPSGQSEIGLSYETNGYWVANNAPPSQSYVYRLYGLSPVLTVPIAAVPEPTSLSTFGILAVVCGLGYRRKRS